jgi:hypothetical protein
MLWLVDHPRWRWPVSHVIQSGCAFFVDVVSELGGVGAVDGNAPGALDGAWSWAAGVRDHEGVIR